jgi:hypothetical protein
VDDVATVALRWTSSSDKQLIRDTYSLPKSVKKEDVEHVTADYPVNNIELAFRSWYDKPWGKHISFDTFCEEILPYRISTEPLENWREKALASFVDVNKELMKDSIIDAVKACSKINKLLPRFRMDKDFPVMNYTQLMASTRSMCDGQAALAAFVMRALGIPVTIDFTPRWVNESSGHTWNSVCDSTGQHVSFMGAGANPLVPHPGTIKLKSKAYRHTFARNRIIKAMETDVPAVFNADIKDISSEHEGVTDIKITAKYSPDKSTGYACLAIIYDFQWHIVASGCADNGNMEFPAVGKDIIYLPVYYMDGNQIPAGDPFRINGEGNIRVFNPDSSDSLFVFSAIMPGNDDVFVKRMTGGVFEGADKSDFSDAKTIHTVKRIPDVHNNVSLSKAINCRYVRYKSPPKGSCNVSEIAFYGYKGEKLEGAHIGTPGAWNSSTMTGEKAFDGNIATFYDALDATGAWTGLDMGEQRKIGMIRYTPRLRGIGIYAGHEYELFCWIKDGWKSLGKQTAVDATLQFRAPGKALFYLYNCTDQKKGRPFFVLNNKIVFI